ncbi:MAG: conjugative transposon protein TraM [Mucilaginibacter sp.]|uniref:conjugative transposon protein TraM n=1 Tax=Mucilaginibacter sp. TaxID=1882438 RepID=UPI003264A09F
MKQLTSEQQQKQRKFLLVLPLLILPFMTMAFWALGGGKDKVNNQNAVSKGINTELPEAQFKDDKPQNKLSLYDQAARDSASTQSKVGSTAFGSMKKDTARYLSLKNTVASANEAEINQKLAQIRQQINHPERAVTPPVSPVTQSNPEADRLEKLIKTMQGGKTEDPEMQQLSAMLDKIQAIQNPDLAREKFRQQSPPTVRDTLFRAVPAAVDGDQKVLQGGIVRLRLQDTMSLKGLLLPQGQLLFGNCTIVNQRLLLNIKNIRIGTAIIPVDLTVFSLDGLSGINAPEAELADAAGSGSGNALQSMTFLPMDQTLATQAAGAGIETAKSLFSKKVRRIRVKLKAGTAVLLKINKN